LRAGAIHRQRRGNQRCATGRSRPEHRRLRQSKIEELGCAAFRDHDVGGLQIAVHDSGPMRSVQGIADLHPDAQQFRQRQCAAAQPVGQGLPFQVLHHQEIGALLVADVIQRADVRMVERGNGLRLALKALLYTHCLCYESASRRRPPAFCM
jgi:hypothetical protein